MSSYIFFFFFFQAEDGIRDGHVTGVQTCALPISPGTLAAAESGPAPPDQRAVPAQDCGRSHQGQGARRKLAAECSQDHAIGCPPARPSSGASQDEQLLTEDEEFEIAIGSLATPDHEQLN